MTTPPGRAGHEDERDYVDKDVHAAEPVEREGELTDADVATDDPDAEREGDYTDKDVTPADTDTAPRSFTAKDVD